MNREKLRGIGVTLAGSAVTLVGIGALGLAGGAPPTLLYLLVFLGSVVAMPVLFGFDDPTFSGFAGPAVLIGPDERGTMPSGLASLPLRAVLFVYVTGLAVGSGAFVFAVG